MTTTPLFHWVILNRDVPDSLVKMGDRGVVVDCLPPNQKQPEPGYAIEVFRDGETLDVISVPISWATLSSKTWDKPNVMTRTKKQESYTVVRGQRLLKKLVLQGEKMLLKGIGRKRIP